MSSAPHKKIEYYKKLDILSLLFSFTLIGCYSTVVQVLLIREFIVVFFGNELCFGIILASWFLSIFLGANAGGRTVHRLKEALPLFLLFQVVICLFPFLQITIIRTIREILHVPPGEYISLPSLTLSTFLLNVPFGVMIGATFPFACKINPLPKGNSPQSIGWVYVLESLGSVIGGLLLTFYFIPRFNPFEILTFITLGIIINSTFLCLLKTKKYLIFLTLFSASGLSFVFLLVFGKIAQFNDFLIEKRWKTYHNQMEMITSQDSLYQNIVVARNEEQYSVFSNGQYLFSFPDPYQTATLTHFLLSQHPDPHSILLVGGGIEGILQEVLKYPISLLHYVELDPKVIEVCLPFLTPESVKLLEDKRLTVFYQDGRTYIKNTKYRYDLVILNLPDPSTAMLNRFYTLEFFEEVKAILQKDGVMVTGITSAVNYIGEEIGMYTGSLYNTLTQVFPYVIITPGEKNYFFATSTPGVATTDIPTLVQRYCRRAVTSTYFTPYHFQMLLPEEQVRFIKHSLEKKSGYRINTDSHPVTYFYNLILWQIFSGERGKINIFKYLPDTWTWFIMPVVILFLLRVGYLCYRNQDISTHLKFNSLLVITTAGFAAMALEIILIFAFQNIYGYVYQKVGMIVAVFMLGLSIGGFWMNRLIAGKERNWVRLLTLLQYLISIYCILLPIIISLFSPRENTGAAPLEYLFMLLVVGAGVLTGVEFPLVSRILITREEMGKVAGWVDAFDHLGACFGALLTGTILVPILGTTKSCLFTGMLTLLSGFLFTIFLIQKSRNYEP